MTAIPGRHGRGWRLLGLALIALVVAGCEVENVIVVQNTTSTQLRVFVKVPGGGISTVVPTPGEASSVVIGEGGTYYAGAIVDADWLAYIRLKREYLASQLDNPDVRRALSVDQLKEISDQLNDLSREIQRATERPWENVGGCSGTVSAGGGGMFDYEDVESAVVQVTDNPAGGFPAFLLSCTSN